MRFFDRGEEIGILRNIREKSRRSARFTVVTGRRRVGKTQLVKRAMEDEPYLYLYVSRKAEKELCKGFQDEIGRVLGLPLVGTADRFEVLFKVVMEESKKRPVTLVIDEFQEFFRVNDSVFSSMADIWDDAHKDAKLNLIVCGSVNRLMNRIFKDRSEPLYGRNTGLLHVDPFKTSVLKDILAFHSPGFSNDDLLALWTLTGGVARYVEQLMDDGAFTRAKMLESIFRRDSPYLDEGMSILYEIDDCFFRFWFRFVWKNMYLKELQRFDVMRDYAARDYEVFSGFALERYFHWRFVEEKKYTRMDAWWDRKGENEIDLVCDDEVSGRLDFFEVKRDATRVDLASLERKSLAFFAKNPQLKSRKVTFSGLSVQDM